MNHLQYKILQKRTMGGWRTGYECFSLIFHFGVFHFSYILDFSFSFRHFSFNSILLDFSMK